MAVGDWFIRRVVKRKDWDINPDQAPTSGLLQRQKELKDQQSERVSDPSKRTLTQKEQKAFHSLRWRIDRELAIRREQADKFREEEEWFENNKDRL